MQLIKLKKLLGAQNSEDEILNFCLENAAEIITNIRRTDIVEPQYLNVQISIAIELYNKMGAEGQTSHGENGINRSYESGDVSKAVLSRITPRARSLTDTIIEVAPYENS